MHLSAHAIQRYRERVENVPPDEVRARLLTQRTLAAINFGARFIRLGNGARLVIRDETIVTVLSPKHAYREGDE